MWADNIVKRVPRWPLLVTTDCEACPPKRESFCFLRSFGSSFFFFAFPISFLTLERPEFLAIYIARSSTTVDASNPPLPGRKPVDISRPEITSETFCLYRWYRWYCWQHVFDLAWQKIRGKLSAIEHLLLSSAVVALGLLVHRDLNESTSTSISDGTFAGLSKLTPLSAPLDHTWKHITAENTSTCCLPRGQSNCLDIGVCLLFTAQRVAGTTTQQSHPTVVGVGIFWGQMFLAG